MAEFLRPEARAALWRAREAIVALVVAALGGWWAAESFGAMRWLGLVVCAAGLVAAAAAVQRLRVPRGGTGPGVVTLDEGRIAYMGPLTGGSIDLASVEVLKLDRGATPPHWILEGQGARLEVPATALGAEVLPDGFAQLRGFRHGQMMAALNDAGRGMITVWDGRRAAPQVPRDGTPGDRRRLH
ncbi:hypothetical protein [Pseudoroseicyclus aestuarii]|uniref:Uncharacterized protein n=1 Tax=Pseudoroseicyclus aestuarii TaxID=1795041 RepID=A0A318T8P7_9RHOB|nr:hypothetical protein [Pseudoroseicyclus aestuarii]PYE84748.1 hypothetical protein DFP88_102551 [Pseudoroseicyclus aestuarii]